MSPTSIGFVLLLGVLHVCSGKTAEPLQSLSVSWKELIWLKKKSGQTSAASHKMHARRK